LPASDSDPCSFVTASVELNTNVLEYTLHGGQHEELAAQLAHFQPPVVEEELEHPTAWSPPVDSATVAERAEDPLWANGTPTDFNLLKADIKDWTDRARPEEVANPTASCASSDIISRAFIDDLITELDVESIVTSEPDVRVETTGVRKLAAFFAARRRADTLAEIIAAEFGVGGAHEMPPV
jgi:hypothetical protein